MNQALPPKRSAEVARLFEKVAATADGSWIADYAEFENIESHGIAISRIHVKDENMAGLLGKSVGYYSTLQTGPLNRRERCEAICACLTEELRRYLAPYMGKVLCIHGVGSVGIPDDALGPETAKRIYSRLPVPSDYEKPPVFSMGVNGTTNICETNAACALAITATDCNHYEEIGSCIRLTDTGIVIRQSGEVVNQSTVGVPVIAIEVPTTVCTDGVSPDRKIPGGEFPPPTDITEVIKYAVSIIACSVLQVVYPELDCTSSKMFVDEMPL